MKSKIIYEPIVKHGDNGNYFIVNGARDFDKKSSIRKAREHCAFRNPDTKIVRVDEYSIYDYNTF